MSEPVGPLKVGLWMEMFIPCATVTKTIKWETKPNWRMSVESRGTPTLSVSALTIANKVSINSRTKVNALFSKYLVGS